MNQRTKDKVFFFTPLFLFLIAILYIIYSSSQEQREVTIEDFIDSQATKYKNSNPQERKEMFNNIKEKFNSDIATEIVLRAGEQSGFKDLNYIVINS